MATVNLTTTDPIEVSPTAGTAVKTPLTPTISTYGTWYKCGTVEWESLPTDMISCNAFVTLETSGITCAGTDRASVFVRSVLNNVTTGFEVWSSAQVELVWYRIGTSEHGDRTPVGSIYDRFWAGQSGLLIPGNEYEWACEVKKEQTFGTPTFTLTVIDSSVFADAAQLNP